MSVRGYGRSLRGYGRPHPRWLITALFSLLFVFMADRLLEGSSGAFAAERRGRPGAEAAPSPRLAATAGAPRGGQLRLPTSFTFCGERVDLQTGDASRRIRREYLGFLRRPQVLRRLQQRALSYFPRIAAVSERKGSCAALKYLAMIESGLRGAASSHAGAHGWWQFIASTASELTLRKLPNWDERASLERSTEAALRYLSQLHRRFGRWTLALAAYNTGLGRLQRAMRAQESENYWALSLPEEAERYVPKLFALVMILRDPRAHQLPAIDLEIQRRIPAVMLSLELPPRRRVSLRAIAQGARVEEAALAALNPQTNDALPLPRATPLQLLVRREDASAMRRYLRRRRLLRDEEERPLGYRVRAGESLWAIAYRSGRALSTLRAWNALGPRAPLYVGQLLRLQPPLHPTLEDATALDLQMEGEPNG